MIGMAVGMLVVAVPAMALAIVSGPEALGQYAASFFGGATALLATMRWFRREVRTLIEERVDRHELRCEMWDPRQNSAPHIIIPKED